MHLFCGRDSLRNWIKGIYKLDIAKRWLSQPPHVRDLSVSKVYHVVGVPR
jgi:hypothetical protein